MGKGICFKGTSCPWSHGIAPGQALDSGGPQYRKGTRVVVEGLVAKSAQKFNGRVGECEEFDGATGRWQVRLGTGDRLKVKEDNLKRCGGLASVAFRVLCIAEIIGTT